MLRIVMDNYIQAAMQLMPLTMSPNSLSMLFVLLDSATFKSFLSHLDSNTFTTIIPALWLLNYTYLAPMITNDRCNELQAANMALHAHKNILLLPLKAALLLSLPRTLRANRIALIMMYVHNESKSKIHRQNILMVFGDRMFPYILEAQESIQNMAVI